MSTILKFADQRIILKAEWHCKRIFQPGGITFDTEWHFAAEGAECYPDATLVRVCAC